MLSIFGVTLVLYFVLIVHKIGYCLFCKLNSVSLIQNAALVQFYSSFIIQTNLTIERNNCDGIVRRIINSIIIYWMRFL
jgi:hypothetical protein